jgi:hypothetical protein
VAHDRHLTSCLYRLADDPCLCQRISRLGQRVRGNTCSYLYVNTHQYTRRAQQYPNPNCYTDTHWPHRYIDAYEYARGCDEYSDQHKYTNRAYFYADSN